jgi:hypothetical protein
MTDWQRHFVHRKESLKTTWKLRVLVVLLAFFAVWITRGFWTVKIGESMICQEQISRSDALLLENFDPDYLVFERAAALQKKGIAAKIFVPVSASSNPEIPSVVSKGLAELMARVAHIDQIEVIPIKHIEPISLNAAYQIRDFLIAENVKSIVVVTPDFRSRRSLMVYSAVLGPAGIAVGCTPVFGTYTPTNWTETWHAMQEAGLQFLKLQYYRFYVLW